MIDSGVAPLPQFAGQLVNGPDLSFGSGDAADGVDQFGHGTHMAGIIAGPRSVGRARSRTRSNNDAKRSFVGHRTRRAHRQHEGRGADGAVDVSQVIAGIDWVIHTATPTASTSGC